MFYPKNYITHGDKKKKIEFLLVTLTLFFKFRFAISVFVICLKLKPLIGLQRGVCVWPIIYTIYAHEQLKVERRALLIVVKMVNTLIVKT